MNRTTSSGRTKFTNKAESAHRTRTMKKGKSTNANISRVLLLTVSFMLITFSVTFADGNLNSGSTGKNGTETGSAETGSKKTGSTGKNVPDTGSPGAVGSETAGMQTGKTGENAAETSDVDKNETVYVILDHDGRVHDQRIVNRIHAGSKTDKVIDFGEYSMVRNMESEEQPLISGPSIQWNAGLLNQGAIYYEGITDRKLPVDISIEYTLDGRRINPADLAGKNGNLKIAVKLQNRLKISDPITYKSYRKRMASKNDEYYVPLLVQVTYAADLDVFSEVKAEDAVRVVAGKTMNLGFAAFPYPDAEIIWEMTGKNMELNPIQMTVIPQLPPIPDIDMEDGLVKLLDGTGEIRKGLERFKSALGPLAAGGSENGSRGQEFTDGLARLSDGCIQLDKNSGALLSGFDASMEGFGQLKGGMESLAGGLNQAAAGMGELSSAARTVAGSAGSLKEGADRIGEASTRLASGLSELSKANDGLSKQAQSLMAQNPEGSDLYRLGAAILAQNEALKALAPAGTELENGTKGLSQGMDTLKGNLENSFVPGMEKLKSSAGELAAGAHNLQSGMAKYEEGQKAYRDGLAQYTGGVGEVSEGVQALNDNTDRILEGLNKLSDAQEQISKGLDRMDADGIAKMESGLIEAIDEIRFGKAKKDRMKDLAEGYRSFMDNERNKNSRVQFLLQTRKISLPEAAKAAAPKKASDQGGIWNKLLNLFRM